MTGAVALDTVRTIADLRARVAAWRADGARVGLVPTMGALHAGHVALVKQSVAACDKTVVTLFVNPAQFGPNEDYAVYPRSEERDAAMVAAEGADLLFAPGVEEVYPGGHSTQVHVGGLGDLLEGEYRPGFFTGVATVVTKLLLQSLPDEAFFGEKDYQQLQVIKRLIRDLDIPVTATGVKTVREDDGLALSSRNAYLTPAERAALDDDAHLAPLAVLDVPLLALVDVEPAHLARVVSRGQREHAAQLVHLEDDAEGIAVADLVAFARNHGISELAIPRKIIHVESIPVLGTGKTDYGTVQKTVEALMADELKPAATEPAE